MEESYAQARAGKLALPVVPVTFGQVRDTCLLAKLMDRIYPGCFKNHRVYEYPVSRQQMRAWESIKVLNYNACCRVLAQLFRTDVRGVSGRDLASGDQKYLSGIVWRLAPYEVRRVDKRVPIGQVLSKLGVGQIDYAQPTAKQLGELLNKLVPDAFVPNENQNELQKMQAVLDVARGCGVWVFQQARDMACPEHAAMFVAQLCELAIDRFGLEAEKK